MKNSKRLFALCLACAFMLSAAPFSASAFGADNKRLTVTHVNTAPSLEGSGIIQSGTLYSNLGSSGGGYDWWKVIIFDWDSDEKVYKVVQVDTRNNGVAKGSVTIPSTGFAYGVCGGNNYPKLYAEKGDPAYKDKPNYTNRPTADSMAYITAANVKVGDKAYVYNVDIANSIVKNNGLQWYDEEFVSESFIQLGEPVEGMTAYNPEEENLVAFDVVPTTIDKIEYAVGKSIIFTPKYGTNANNGGNASFEWWHGIVFEFDPDEGCYVVRSIDRNASASAHKQPVIPANGFVLLDCGKNTAVMGNIGTGMKCNLYDIDLANQKVGASARITFNEDAPGEGAYIPAAAGKLASPVIKEAEDGVIDASESELKISWDAVPGAEKYIVSVNDSTETANGRLVLAPTGITGTSFTVPANTFSTGNRYSLRVIAAGGGKYSPFEQYRVVCMSEQTKNSSLRKKTIVAFGDSLTARSGYVNMLYGYLGTEVINSGVGGDSTNHGMARFTTDVLDKDPDIVTICFGMNDQACVISRKQPNVSLEKYRENLEYFAKTLVEAGVDVVFVTPNPVCTESGYYKGGEYGLDYGYGFMDDFCNVMREVAHKYDCGLVDVNYECSFEDLTKFLNAGDGIHQSTYGHQRYAALISDYLFAAYDGTDKAEMTVKCVDAGGKELFTRKMAGKSGANVTVAAPLLDGYSANEKPVATKFKDGETFTFTYRAQGDPKPAVKLGDVNGDGNIDALDYAMVKRHVLGTYTLTEDQIPAADINGDGNVDALDYAMVKRHVLGTFTIE